ncbi:MAG: hypothetical protein ACXW4E_03240 [Anaerolineales bacterium]
MPTQNVKSSSGNLPAPVSVFIGREHETEEVKQLLLSNRLVALTSPGGCGKMRLALKVAHESLGEFEHGIWFAELASIFDPILVPQAVASTLNIREQSGQSLMDILVNNLSARRVLLVIDNCDLVGDGEIDASHPEALIYEAKKGNCNLWALSMRSSPRPGMPTMKCHQR